MKGFIWTSLMLMVIEVYSEKWDDHIYYERICKTISRHVQEVNPYIAETLTHFLDLSDEAADYIVSWSEATYHRSKGKRTEFDFDVAQSNCISALIQSQRNLDEDDAKNGLWNWFKIDEEMPPFSRFVNRIKPDKDNKTSLKNSGRFDRENLRIKVLRNQTNHENDEPGYVEYSSYLRDKFVQLFNGFRRKFQAREVGITIRGNLSDKDFECVVKEGSNLSAPVILLFCMILILFAISIYEKGRFENAKEKLKFALYNTSTEQTL